MKYDLVGNMHIIVDLDGGGPFSYQNNTLNDLKIRKLVLKEVIVSGDNTVNNAFIYRLKSNLPSLSNTLCMFSGNIGVSNPSIEIRLGDTLKNSIIFNVEDFAGTGVTQIADRLLSLSFDLYTERK